MNSSELPFDPEAAREAHFQGLLARCRSGDPAAIGQLVEQFRLILLDEVNRGLDGDLRAKVGCSDIVQESMLAAQRSFSQFSGSQRGEFLAWLYKIVRNDMLETVRRFKYSTKRNIERESPTDNRSFAQPIIDRQRSPAATVMIKEQAAILHAAMARLSPDYQRVIQLRNWEQLPFGEIGTMMNRSEDAARKLWTRALAELQAEMAGISSFMLESGKFL
jgi:RNA polymerase sigma-70 factor (ECF subfamily)